MAVLRTVVFQTPNRIGLGHLNRSASIALAMRSFSPATRIQFVIEGSSHSFLEQFGLPFITLPTAWDPQRSQALNDERRSILKTTSDAILDTFRPDLIVYDCLPHFHFMEAVRRRNIPTALCLRKVKDFKKYSQNPRVSELLGEQPLLIIPHEENEFPIPVSLLPRAKYVGEIVRPTIRGNDVNEGVVGQSEKRLIVITGGGGGDPSTLLFYNLSLAALRAVSHANANITVLLIAGPLFKEWRSLQLFDGVHVSPFEPHIELIFRQCSLVISQGGYNSLAELKKLNVPTICIPQPREFDDQYDRAQKYSAESGSMFRFLDTDSAALSSLITTVLLTDRLPQAPTASTSGAERAAQLLLHFMEARSLA